MKEIVRTTDLQLLEKMLTWEPSDVSSFFLEEANRPQNNLRAHQAALSVS